MAKLKVQRKTKFTKDCHIRIWISQRVISIYQCQYNLKIYSVYSQTINSQKKLQIIIIIRL